MTGEVAAAWVHPAEVDASFMLSMLKVVARELLTEQRLTRYLPIRCGTNGLIAARNEVVTQFLDTDADWLWWVDTDMGFEDDALDRLLAVADPEKAPVVGGLCFAQKQIESDGMGGIRAETVPALYRWGQNDEGKSGFVAWKDYPRDAVAEVAATGSAFVLIHRAVFEKVAEAHGAHWYDRLVNPLADGQLLGEDLSFCARVRMLGIPIFVHTGIATTHRKPQYISELDYQHPDDQEGEA